MYCTRNKMYKLRTKPTQFVKGKTEETLCDIMKRWEENCLLNNDSEDLNDSISDKHLIDIIVTNNSLLETEMWKYRTVNKFKQEQDIKIHILSSKSNDFKNINTYISQIIQATKKNQLPNVLIVCYHTKRVCSDIVTLCSTFGGIHKMKLPNIAKETNINFHISFDEPDANIGVTKKFLSNINDFIKNETITGILFITATPIDDFWKMLNKSGIKQLLNMNRDTVHNFDEDFKNYRSFKDHNIIEHNNDTTNPLTYIMNLFREKKIDESKRKIIFAPGHLYTKKKNVGSHDEIEEFFIGKGYDVLKINGNFKGFIYPNGIKETLEEYKQSNKISGELRETLKFWSENNENTNLAITGYWVIERGVTFNTINFNFTDMILSNYHLKTLSKLIQLVGRGAGGKLYVDVMNVFCTTEIRNTIEEFNCKLNQICSLNPELFNRTDFITSKNTIPIKLDIIDNDLVKKLVELRVSAKRGYKVGFHNNLVNGIREKKIIMYDNNNIKFDISNREIKDVRMYDKEKHKAEVRRFKNFNEAFENFKTSSQSCNENQYNVDFAKDRYELNEFVNETNIFWITYRV